MAKSMRSKSRRKAKRELKDKIYAPALEARIKRLAAKDKVKECAAKDKAGPMDCEV